MSTQWVDQIPFRPGLASGVIPVVRPASVQPDQGTTSIVAEAVATPTVEPPTVEPVDDDALGPYVAQRGGRLFHRRECRWASRIGRDDRVGFPAAADAERQGFVSCPACEVSEPVGAQRI